MPTLEELDAEIEKRERLSQIDSLIQQKTPEPTIGDQAVGALENAASIASSAVAEPVAGIAGLIQAANPFAEEGAGARAVEATTEALTYQPQTEAGQSQQQAIGETLAPVGEIITSVQKYLGDTALDLTGSPEIATAAYSAPTIVAELLGLKGLRSVKGGTRLIDEAGEPTKALIKALDQKGLDFYTLTPEAKALIPKVAKQNFLPRAPKAEASKAAERALIKQIETGARNDSLAGLKVINGKIGSDAAANNAIKQGFRPGLVQSVKTASPETKAEMLKMSRIARRVKAAERAGLDMRPSDVVGDAVTRRIRYIKDVVNDARKELDLIANNKLKGLEINPDRVIEQLQESLADLDVELAPSVSGKPSLNFDGSLISKDKTSQRVIRDVIDLLGEGGVPDAQRAHKLKRQLDIMIDFNKKSSEGLTDAGRNVLKDVRRALNESIREVDPDYARVNDKLSTALGALNSVDEAMGGIDVFGKGSNKAIGTRARALMSNQQGRVKMENAIDEIEFAADSLQKGRGTQLVPYDEAARRAGYAGGEDVKDLVMFANALEEQFGTQARTSFAGQAEQAVSQAMREGPRQSVVGAAAEVAGKGAEKLRGINDKNAFEAIEKLLKP